MCERDRTPLVSRMRRNCKIIRKESERGEAGQFLLCCVVFCPCFYLHITTFSYISIQWLPFFLFFLFFSFPYLDKVFFFFLFFKAKMENWPSNFLQISFQFSNFEFFKFQIYLIKTFSLTFVKNFWKKKYIFQSLIDFFLI